ncbi:DUF2231 domain-containing protein [Thalassiella azotivora]
MTTAGGVFDTVAGLPVHVLVVHAVVVGVPVASLLTVAVAAVPRWRSRPAWAVAALNGVLLVVAWVATQSGEALERRVGEAVVEEHSDLGEVLPWFVLGLLVVSVLVPVVRHRRPLATTVLVLAVVAGLAATVWTVRVGDSGARAVWEPVVENTTT